MEIGHSDFLITSNFNVRCLSTNYPCLRTSDADCEYKVGRLPNHQGGIDHVTAFFTALGFTEKEMVALIGAHTLGSAKKNTSGFPDQTWDTTSSTFDNSYYTTIIKEEWALVVVTEESGKDRNFLWMRETLNY